MAKNKNPQFSLKALLYPVVLVGLVYIGLKMGVQVADNLGTVAVSSPLQPAIVIDPVPTKKAVATPKPTPVPAPTAAKVPVVAYVPPHRYIPPVHVSPSSSVKGLVPATVPTPTPATTPTPTISPAAGASPAPSSSPSPSPSSSPSGGIGGTAPPVTTYSSANWSGYVASAGTFTGVSGSWKVPNVTGTGTSYSGDAAWVGIGGVTSGDLIQTGTDDTVTPSGTVVISAFYELLPAAETPITSMTVSPGDTMTANIELVSGDNWTIAITDVTTGDSFSISVTYASSESTAEWIQEDPSYTNGRLVPLDTFGQVPFTDSATIEGGTNISAASAGAQSIALVGYSGQVLASPDALTTAGNFTVTQY